MIESLFWLFVLFGPSAIEAFNDPGLGIIREPKETRRHECTPLDLNTARKIRPEAFGKNYPRGDFLNREAFLCQEQIVEPGLRSPQTEQLITHLSSLTTTLAAKIQAAHPNVQRWMVEVHSDEPVVGHKVDFATKVALSELGLQVSDHVPNLRPTDLGVIGRLSHSQAHDVSCRRLIDDFQIDRGDALIRILVVDPRQTNLIYGVCTQAGWSCVP